MKITRRDTARAALAGFALAIGGRTLLWSTASYADEAKTEPESIPNAATSAGPAWTVHGDKTLMAWKGEGTDTAIYWATSSKLKPDSGSNKYDWTAEQSVPHAATSAAPALASMNGVVYLAWKGNGDDKAIYLSKLDAGGTWSAKQRAGDGTTSDGPALAKKGDTLFLAWRDGDQIFCSTSADGASWSHAEVVPDAKASKSPTLASDGDGDMYLAWKGTSGGTSPIWWSKSSDGKSWKPKQKGPNGAATGPALAVDSNKVVWLTWTGLGRNYTILTPGELEFDSDVVFLSKLSDELKNEWTPGTYRIGFDTLHKPALISTGHGDTGLMLAAASGANTNNIHSIAYAPLLLPAQSLSFGLRELVVHMMRTGHAGLKDGSDTVYASIGVKIKGKPAKQVSKLVGDLTGGTYQVGLSIPETIADTDMVYLTYAAINSGAGAASAGAFLENSSSKLLDACEKADEAAIQDLTGINLSWLPPQEAGALVGAQLGSYVLPGFGTVIGALAGFFSGSIGGFLEPNCDGPVAIGLFAFSAPQIRATLKQAGQSYYEADDHPGVTSQSGCGDNSNYIAGWEIAKSP